MALINALIVSLVTHIGFFLICLSLAIESTTAGKPKLRPITSTEQRCVAGDGKTPQAQFYTSIDDITRPNESRDSA